MLISVNMVAKKTMAKITKHHKTISAEQSKVVQRNQLLYLARGGR